MNINGEMTFLCLDQTIFLNAIFPNQIFLRQEAKTGRQFPRLTWHLEGTCSGKFFRIFAARTGRLPIFNLGSQPGSSLFGCLLAVSKPLLVAHYNAKWNVGPLYSFVSVKKLYNVSLWTHTVKGNWDKLVIGFFITHILESATSWFHTTFIVLMYRAEVESWESSIL